MDGNKKWSAEVTERSDALELKEHVFEKDDPKEIASSRKCSAEKSKRRKAEPFHSAMSMLAFYVNRASKNVPSHGKKVLQEAKDELRRVWQAGSELMPPSQRARSVNASAPSCAAQWAQQ